MRMQRHITVVTLVVIVSFLAFAAERPQASGRPDGTVWQVVASGSALRSVYVAADGRHGWAVGVSGRIVATQDGGGHWTLQTRLSSNLRGVAFAADGRRGWVVGDNGTIIATEDGGGHWRPQASSTSDDLWGVAFAADGRRGWAVGGNGTIIATEDGGGHWAPQTSSISYTLSAVAFSANGRRGWAVGDNGTIIATEDGGGRPGLDVAEHRRPDPSVWMAEVNGLLVGELKYQECRCHRGLA
jgi:photosystem II stability/assembly factor-like uncharacterized protein